MRTEVLFTKTFAMSLTISRPIDRVEERVCTTVYTDNEGARSIEATIVALVDGERYQLSQVWSGIDQLHFPKESAALAAERLRDAFEEVVRG